MYSNWLAPLAGEGTKVFHDVEWVRGLRGHPSPIVRGNTRVALSRKGRGHCNEHCACGRISRCQTAHLAPGARRHIEQAYGGSNA